MGKRKQKANTIKNENIVKRLRLFLLAALTVITFYPPYLQGLFFEKNVLPAQMIVFSVFIVFLVYKWLKNDYAFLKTPIDYVALGFVVVYFISIFVAVHTRSAIIEWLKYCMYFAVFYMITDLADNLKTKLLFLWTIVISAVGVSVLGLDAAMGGNIVELLNRIYKALGAQSNLFFGLFVDNRIHSTLQYPNALASYLMAVFFITVGLLMIHNKWWEKIILGSFSFILFLTFMLTQSRGAQLLFPVAVIILLIASPKYNRVKAVTYVLLLAAPAVLISLFFSPYLSANTLNQKTLLLLLSGLFITATISIGVKLIGNRLQKVNWRIYAAVISLLLLIISIGGYFLLNASMPLELSHRVDDEDSWKQVTKKLALQPNKEYILSYEVEALMQKEQPYAYYISIYSESEKNILFGEPILLYAQSDKATNGIEKKTIKFHVPEDSKFITLNFVNNYSGTSVRFINAFIIDATSGDTLNKLMLKNKYNLDSIISRFQNLWYQQSFISRVIFYRDGIDIFKDKWLIGSGGGAWNYLYRQYQSYNYASSQAHNYPLQLGIETGTLGIIILISLVIIITCSYKMYYKKIKNINNSTEMNEIETSSTSGLLYASIITAIAALFIHSIMDFDFSESAILLLFWQLISLFNRELIDCLVLEDLKLFNTKMEPKRKKFTISKRSKSTLFIGIVISTITLYFSLTFFIASSFAKQSFVNLQKNDLEAAISKMEKAINLDRYNEKYVIGYNPIPNRPDIKTGLIDILFIKNEVYKKVQENDENISETDLVLFQKQFSESASYIKEIERKAENNLSLTIDLASYCFKTGEIDKGINYLNSAISYFPFEPSLWHSKVDVYYQLMREYFNKEDFENAKEYLLKGLNVINEAKDTNKRNMNPFVFNQNTSELLQTMKFMQEHWNTNAIYDINKVVHYSIFDLDIDMDGIPDQWRVNDTEFMDISNYEGKLSIKASGRVSLYTRYPIKLKKGSTYRFEIQLKDSVESISYYISGITTKALPLSKEDSKYVAEIMVENEPSENGSQFRIYVEDNCVIEKILIKEINSKY